MKASDICTKLKRGEELADSYFDALYSKDFRKSSNTHFCEIKIAQICAEFLAPTPESKVLDVGSGIGKFCIVGALKTGAFFSGFELREDLVKEAKALTRTLKVERVSFENIDALEASWDNFDGIFLFNPFYEATGAIHRITNDIEPSRKKYLQAVHKTQEKLKSLKAGTRLALYYGFGGAVPESFKKIEFGPINIKHLDFWEQR